MKLKEIDKNDLGKIKSEGLILQGCGGDPQEWLDGINELLKDKGIILNDTKFETVYRFKDGELTNICFELDEVEANLGKLAIWRLTGKAIFGGMWLSDYLDQHTEIKHNINKPKCNLLQQDGNIFNLLGIVSKTLKTNGLDEQSVEMRERVINSDSYMHALEIISDYVEIEGLDEMDIEMEME